MLSEEELQEAAKQSQKNEIVKKLFDFYCAAQVDGESAIRIALNNKWLEFSQVIKDISIPLSNTEKNEALSSLIDITKLWKGVAKDKEKEEDVKELKIKKGHEGKAVV